MKFNRIWSSLKAVIPIILSLSVFAFMLCGLICKLNSDLLFKATLVQNRSNIMTISGLISGLIIAYLTAKVLQVRQEKITKLPELMELTQKLHKCRSIMDRLLRSRLWPVGVSSFVDKKYIELTYFDVREIIIVNSKPSKLALTFIDDKDYNSLARFYLELKSFKLNHYAIDHTLYTEFEVPVFYDSNIVQKWLDYDCGNGLWYYFEHKYAVLKNSMNLLDIYDGHKKEIKDNCLKIDRERYKNLEFGPELLAKLGTQLTDDILPNLARVQNYMDSGLPRIIKYLFLIAGILIVSGVALPLLNSIYSISPIIDIISISIVLSTSFYLVLSFYGFMKSEIKLF